LGFEPAFGVLSNENFQRPVTMNLSLTLGSFLTPGRRMFLWLNKCEKAYARKNGCLVVSQDSEPQLSQTTTSETLRDRRINKTRCDNSNAFFIAVPMMIMATVAIVEEMEAERCSIKIHLRIRHCPVIDTNMKDKSRSGVNNARKPTCDKCGKTRDFISRL
jgi:hypothetical protein